MHTSWSEISYVNALSLCVLTLCIIYVYCIAIVNANDVLEDGYFLRHEKDDGVKDDTSARLMGAVGLQMVALAGGTPSIPSMYLSSSLL